MKTHKPNPLLPLVAMFLLCMSCNQVQITDSLDTDLFMERSMESLGAPGMAVLSMRDEEVLYEGYFGQMEQERLVTDKTLFMLASVSKTITATAILQLVDQNLLDLDEDVNVHLPFEVINPRYPNEVITVRMLLKHTSGIRDRMGFYMRQYTILSEGGDSPSVLSDFIGHYLSVGGKNYSRRNYLNRPPGSTYNYSNYGIALLAVILEEITGESFDEYCRKNIFVPLSMTDTSWFLNDLDEERIAHPWFLGEFRNHFGYPDYPSGQLRTSARELAAFAGMWSHDGVWNGTRILSSEIVETALYKDHFDIGLVWHFTETGKGFLPSHDGDDPGVMTKLIIDPRNHSAVILLVNASWRNGRDFDSIWSRLLEETY